MHCPIKWAVREPPLQHNDFVGTQRAASNCRSTVQFDHIYSTSKLFDAIFEIKSIDPGLSATK